MTSTLHSTAAHVKKIVKSVHLRLKRRISPAVLDRYFNEVNNVYIANTPLFLSVSPQPLQVNLGPNRLVSSIKIQLKDTECLHLHSIALLDTKGKPLSATKEGATIRLSSIYGHGKLEMKAHESLLFNTEGNHKVAFHTRTEKNPWIEIQLSKPRKIGSIILNNRADEFAVRARHLHIYVRYNIQKNWHTVYAVDIEKLHTKIHQLSQEHGIERYAYGELLESLVLSVLAGENLKSNHILYSLPTKLQQTIRMGLNDTILNKKGLEWTKHGLSRLFKFWGEQEKKSYITTALLLIEDLKSITKDVCLGYGTALAAIRDGELIPHDDDIDILLGIHPDTAKDIPAGLSLIENRLRDLGYTVNGNFKIHRHIISNNFKFDVFVGIYNSDEADPTIGWLPWPRYTQKRSDLFPSDTQTLLDIPCPIPRKSSKYLEFTYGKNWRTPDPNWTLSHNWNTREYDDLL
jgi:hypothetical protein